jgi:hypothetical protein
MVGSSYGLLLWNTMVVSSGLTTHVRAIYLLVSLVLCRHPRMVAEAWRSAQ